MLTLYRGTRAANPSLSTSKPSSSERFSQGAYDSGMGRDDHPPRVLIDRCFIHSLAVESIESFRQTLREYGFKKHAEREGSYRHVHFVRGRPDLLTLLESLRVNVIEEMAIPDCETEKPSSESNDESSKDFRESLGDAARIFPGRLFQLLHDANTADFSDIVSWGATGENFRVHDSKRFEAEIMPRYFSKAKFASFRRQLSLYGFSRITTGRSRGSYRHDHFHRDQPQHCELIRRTSTLQGHGSDHSTEFKMSHSDSPSSLNRALQDQFHSHTQLRYADLEPLPARRASSVDGHLMRHRYHSSHGDSLPPSGLYRNTSRRSLGSDPGDDRSWASLLSHGDDRSWNSHPAMEERPRSFTSAPAMWMHPEPTPFRRDQPVAQQGFPDPSSDDHFFFVDHERGPLPAPRDDRRDF